MILNKIRKVRIIMGDKVISIHKQSMPRKTGIAAAVFCFIIYKTNK